MHIAGMRERNTAGGGALDAISVFRRAEGCREPKGPCAKEHEHTDKGKNIKLLSSGPHPAGVPLRFHWKLDGTTDPLLRKLCHKDLRCLAADTNDPCKVLSCSFAYREPSGYVLTRYDGSKDMQWSQSKNPNLASMFTRGREQFAGFASPHPRGGGFRSRLCHCGRVCSASPALGCTGGLQSIRAPVRSRPMPVGDRRPDARPLADSIA